MLNHGVAFLGLLPMLKSCIFTFLFTHSGYFLLSFVCSIYSLPFGLLLTAVDAHFPFWWKFIYSPCNPVSYSAIKFSKLIEGNLNPPVCKFIVSLRHGPEHWFGMKYLNKYEIVWISTEPTGWIIITLVWFGWWIWIPRVLDRTCYAIAYFLPYSYCYRGAHIKHLSFFK